MKFTIAFIGFGTVGQGLAEILADRGKWLREEYGFEYSVVAVSDSIKGSVCDPGGLDLPHLLSLVKEKGSINDYPQGDKGWDSLKTIRQSPANTVVEVTYTDLRTGEPALTHIRTALSLGKHVVTSNKGPAALAYRELRDLARQKGVFFKFEGAVMSGTPLLNLALNHLEGARISEVRGILNGTTNFILTQMEKGLSYEEALAEAQRLGYAEAKPDADVEGWDAVAKVLILANLLMNTQLKVEEVSREGITNITPAHIQEAMRKKCRWKLIGSLRREGSQVRAKVAPEKIPLDDILAGVGGITNALTFSTDLLGKVTIVGPGAGRKETGFALLSDLLEISRSVS
ncbi:homoserine dehydrogenase [bacterium (candidate division B38) B3_B38]|nr:MAG: homoserine dehydrogenase [bacterium (candidate division B38) B3_B38]